MHFHNFVKICKLFWSYYNVLFIIKNGIRRHIKPFEIGTDIPICIYIITILPNKSWTFLALMIMRRYFNIISCIDWFILCCICSITHVFVWFHLVVGHLLLKITASLFSYNTLIKLGSVSLFTLLSRFRLTFKNLSLVRLVIVLVCCFK